MSGTTVGLLLLAASVSSAADLDATRAAWRFRRDVQVAPRDGFAELALPPELVAHAAPDLRDLRLVDQGGADVPYVVDRRGERVTARVHAGTLVDTRRDPIGAPDDRTARASWTVDLGEPRTFDTLALEVPGADFAKHVRVEASADQASWRTVRDDAPIFSRAWQGRVRHTAIVLDAPETARYLRLTTRDTSQSPAVELTGLTASWVRRAPGETWSRPAVVTPVSRGRVSRYRVEVPPGLPLEMLTIDADDPAFARRVVLVEVVQEAGRTSERVASDGALYRVRLPEEDLAGEQRVLTLAQPPSGGALYLDVHDGDSPPLRGLRATASGTALRLVFAAAVVPVALYYGNDVTRAPVYDLAALSARLAATRDLAPAQVGPERPNAAFARPAPLALGGLRGAAVDPKRWRFVRALETPGRDDLYVTTLAPSDLGRLRPDLGDLRVVDDAARQVPYILEASAAEVPVPLEVEPLPAVSGRAVSRYRLRAAALRGGERPALPLHGLALDVPEPFFDRRVRVLVPGEGKRRGTLADAAVQRQLRLFTDERPPVRLEWAPTFARELELEIDEGDNAPLTLAGVQGLVRVPRLTFPAGAGAYRLLLGNPEAERPRYDLASLRAEVLAFSAVPVVPQDAAPNGAYRRGAGDYLKDAPPTLVLWGALVLAVVGLGWLTARVLRHPPAGSAPPPPPDAGA
jgi:uncharacterized protein DUF3999/F5/8 type C domain-containing protein